jgi:hypothetical protein
VRRAVVAAVAVLGVLGAGGTGVAQAPRSESVIDAARDVDGRLDIRALELRLLRGHRRLRGEVRMRRSWGTADLRTTEGMDGSICLRLFVEREPDSQAPEFLVCATPEPDGEGLRGRVYREPESGMLERVAGARVTRPSGRAVRLRFRKRLLGRKLVGVRFGAESVSRGRGCPEPVGCRDLAPEPPGTMYLDLR